MERAMGDEGMAVDCICPIGCDCQCPEPESGVALVSDHCPVHNDMPTIDPECKYTGLVHNNGALYL